MATGTAPDEMNPAPGLGPEGALKLPIDAWYHLARTLSLVLPPPPSDDQEALTQRNHAVIVRIAALAPADPMEADLAADFVIATEQGRSCLRAAGLRASAPEAAAKCRAEARCMMREARSALRSLLQLQKERRMREADPAAGTIAARTEQCALGMLTEMLSAAACAATAECSQPKPAPVADAPPQPAPESAPQSAPESAPGPALAALTGIAATRHAAETGPVLIAAAERYAAAIPSAPPRSAAAASCPQIRATSTRPKPPSPQRWSPPAPPCSSPSTATTPPPRRRSSRRCAAGNRATPNRHSRENANPCDALWISAFA